MKQASTSYVNVDSLTILSRPGQSFEIYKPQDGANAPVGMDGNQHRRAAKNSDTHSKVLSSVHDFFLCMTAVPDVRLNASNDALFHLIFLQKAIEEKSTYGQYPGTWHEKAYSCI